MRYVAAAILLLVLLAATASGLQWYWSLIGFCVVFVLVLGKRRILRPGVTRTADDIVCRYIPWSEGNAMVLNLVLPIVGIAGTAAAFAPGNPMWLKFVGPMLILFTPLFTYAAVRMWRRCILRFSAAALTIRTAAPKDVLTEVPRHRVRSIAPKVVPNGVSGESLQVEIVYATSDSGTDTRTVLLGLQLSVQPKNLLDALVAWKDATGDDPNELLDQIEGILRGRSPAVV
nr:hypothetical protein [Mycolicibacterium sp. P1-18]